MNALVKVVEGHRDRRRSLLWLVPSIFTATVAPNEIGVRQSATSGVLADDLGPGWHWRIPGIHKLIVLPASYFMLDYTNDDKGPQKPLIIRTKDNNTVELDVSVPMRIKPGEANELVAGRQPRRGSRRSLSLPAARRGDRDERAARGDGDLDSVGFYSTDRRLAASEAALEMLNKQLAPMHLEAQAVLVRAVRFRPEYEKQLQTIQLNEQNKLLDAAAQKLAGVQQSLDNYIAGHERAGLGAHAGLDQASGRARARLPGRPPRRRRCDAGCGAREARRRCSASDVDASARQAAKLFGIDAASVTEAYLIGIKNIQAETLEYKNRITADRRRIEARLGAEGDAHGREGSGRVREQAQRAARHAGRSRVRCLSGRGQRDVPARRSRSRRRKASPRCCDCGSSPSSSWVRGSRPRGTVRA